MGIYDTFKTNKSFESEGVEFQYPSIGFKVKMARAGGDNTKFKKEVEKLGKPHKREIQNGTIDKDVMFNLMVKSFSTSVILEWWTLSKKEDFENGDENGYVWERGIEQPDGSVKPDSPQNIERALKDVPELFEELAELAQDYRQFQDVDREADLGN